MESEKENVINILQTIQRLHYPSGLSYKYLQKLKSLSTSENEELEKIYYLVESLAPALRLKSALRYERAIESDNFDKNFLPLNKSSINFYCNAKNISESIDALLLKVKSLPKEWTLIQISSQLNIKERLETGLQRNYTNPLHLIVFNCGQNEKKPFCITVDTPKDKVSNCVIEICKEMQSLIKDNKELITNVYKTHGTKHISAKTYYEVRSELDNRLKEIIKVLQDRWLGAWRCLLIGKYVATEKERLIDIFIEELLQEFNLSVSDKIKTLLHYITKGTSHLLLHELREAVKFCFPQKDKAFYTRIIKKIKDFADKNYVGAFTDQKRNPVILIVEEIIDIFPWEMLDVLQDHPVSRMPSFHFTYGLFKEHEDTIVNGFKVNIKHDKGSYIINPSLDLKKMEVRLQNFFNYWTTDWKGVVGKTPTPPEFEDLLTSNDVFVYAGHGSGNQFLSGDKIQRLRVNGVVFLFGCSSVKLQCLGPQVEMHGSHHMYLIACSPCVIGALWEITDVDTDIFATELLSQWIPSNASIHWKLIDRKKWEKGEAVTSNSQKLVKNFKKNESELLRALCNARKAANYFTTQATFVARGLPVKMDLPPEVS